MWLLTSGCLLCTRLWGSELSASVLPFFFVSKALPWFQQCLVSWVENGSPAVHTSVGLTGTSHTRLRTFAAADRRGVGYSGPSSGRGCPVPASPALGALAPGLGQCRCGCAWGWPVHPGPGWRDTCCVLGVSQAPLTVGCWVHREERQCGLFCASVPLPQIARCEVVGARFLEPRSAMLVSL